MVFSKRLFLILFWSLMATTPGLGQDLPAFPGATGFGKYAKGGRGGDVYIVSNLNNSGAGSLRECAEAVGPRTCVFAVSGEIRTEDAIVIRNPYLTIAGQTAPGDGIQLSIRNTDSRRYPLLIQTHDVVVRYISVRPGPPREVTNNVDAILIEGQNIILDHLSLSWANDEVLNIIGNRGAQARVARRNSSNITVQWSLLYEGLLEANHKKGKHSNIAHFSDGPTDITFHHNLIAHGERRMPNAGVVGQFDFVNNVIYNWNQYAGEVYSSHGSSFINWIGNVAIAGFDTANGGANAPKEKRWALNAFNSFDIGEFELFVDDNLDLNRLDSSVDPRATLDPKDWNYLAAAPVGYGLSLDASEVTGPEQAYRDVLAFAGARLPVRDAADARVVDEVRTCSGAIISHPNERGGWPTLNAAPAPADSDADGMTDAWELDRGLNPNDAADRNGDLDGDGYTNLEAYLQELAGDAPGGATGQGSGAAPDPTCGFTLIDPPIAEIYTFEVSPRVAAPGQTVDINYDARADKCNKSWNRNLSPRLTTGRGQVSATETQIVDLFCNSDGVQDWQARTIFVSSTGEIPEPEVILSTDKVVYDVGEPIEVSWEAGRPNRIYAGICRASGLWSGFRSQTGIETLIAETSGDLILECEGPGGVDADSLAISVNGAPPPPPPPPPPANIAPTAVAAATPLAGDAPLDVTFSASGSSDPDGQIVAYAWDFDGDGVADASGAAASTTYADAGAFTARLTVTDDDGASDTATVTITVNDPAPPPPPPPSNLAPTAVIDATPTTGDAPLDVVFSAAGSNDPDGQIVEYSWDFDGDGATDATGASASTIYADPGAFTARLTVTDDDGATDAAATTITVAQAPPPPPPPGGFGVGARVEVRVKKSRPSTEPNGAHAGRFQRRGSQGVIIAGPVVAGGETWWEVDFDAGTDGWMREITIDLAP